MAEKADGSVVISFDADVSEADKELAKLKKKIADTESEIEKTQKARDEAHQQGIISAAELDAEKAKLQEMKWELLEIRQVAKDKSYSLHARDEAKLYATDLKTDISEQQERVRLLQSDYNKIVSSIDSYEKKLKDANETLEQHKETAGELVKQIEATKTVSYQMSEAVNTANGYVDKFSKRLVKLAKNALVFTVISSALRSLKSWMWKAIKTNDDATASVAKLKGALLTLVQPLVNVIIPAFTKIVNILAKFVAEIAKVVSILFGTTAEASADAAENLYDEMEAVEGVGSAAKKATKMLAAFDEINQLTSETASSGSSVDTIVPDFSGGLLSGLTISLTDILFKWNDLTAEDILAKIVTALGAIAGGVIGFTVGGPLGAAIGIAVGAGLGLKLANILFDGDGELSSEELLRLLVTALNALAGAVIGFSVGGVGGAAIGLVVGAGIGLKISEVLFNGDGKLDDEEILKAIVAAFGALAGGVIGFVVGGPLGAAIGVIVGAGITAKVLSAVFDGDGKISKDEIVTMIRDVLIVIAGGVIGFAIGGPAGALIGIAVGAGVVLTISSLEAEGGKAAQIAQKFLQGLKTALTIICGGIIGFAIGGPGGAVIGMIIAAGITFTMDNSNISFSGGAKGVIRGAGRDIVNGVEDGAEDEMSSVWGWLKDQVVDPIVEDFKALFGIHSPSTVMAEQGIYIMQGLMNGVVSMVASVVSVFSGLWTSIQGVFSHITDWFRDKFTEAWQAVKDVFSSGGKVFDGIKDGILEGLKAVINVLISGINKVIAVPFNGINSALRKIRSIEILGFTPFSGISTISVPQIPKLAEGAVIPPNREFLAVLGDQRSGTNIETPLSTMVEAFKQAMAESGNSGTYTFVVNLDGREVARNTIRHMNDMTRERGKSVVLV